MHIQYVFWPIISLMAKMGDDLFGNVIPNNNY
jgi:hypothetical protein